MQILPILILLTLASCVQTTKDEEQAVLFKQKLEQNQIKEEADINQQREDFAKKKQQEEEDQKFNRNENLPEYNDEEMEFNKNLPETFW
jgi:hypothetical protein